MPKDTDDCIILYEDIPNRGQWTALPKYNGIYEHVDVYGAKPDKSLERVNLHMRRKLNKTTPCCTNIIKCNQHIYNHVKV